MQRYCLGCGKPLTKNDGNPYCEECRRYDETYNIVDIVEDHEENTYREGIDEDFDLL